MESRPYWALGKVFLSQTVPQLKGLPVALFRLLEKRFSNHEHHRQLIRNLHRSAKFERSAHQHFWSPSHKEGTTVVASFASALGCRLVFF